MIGLQTILFAFGISLDSLGIMILEGSMYREIKQKDLAKQSLLIGLWQAIGFLIGNRLVTRLLREDIESNLHLSYNSYLFISFVIFVGLGIWMLSKGLRSNVVLERRRESVNLKRTLGLAMITSVDALVAGLALSFSGIRLSSLFVVIFLVSILSVITGLYIGHLLGYKYKSNAHILSGIIFLSFAIYILFK